MAADKIKVEVVFTSPMYEKLRLQAETWSFSAVPPLIRLLVAAELNGGGYRNGPNVDLSSPKLQALRLMELMLMSSRVECSSLSQALDYLYLQLVQRKQRQHMDKRHWTRLWRLFHGRFPDL